MSQPGKSTKRATWVSIVLTSILALIALGVAAGVYVILVAGGH